MADPVAQRITITDPTTGLPCLLAAGPLGRVLLYALPDGSVVWANVDNPLRQDPRPRPGGVRA